MTDPDTDWHVVGPGRIELPTTKFAIQWFRNRECPFILEWDGGSKESYLSLTGAKNGARRRMRELLAIGIEP